MNLVLTEELHEKGHSPSENAGSYSCDNHQFQKSVQFLWMLKWSSLYPDAFCVYNYIIIIREYKASVITTLPSFAYLSVNYFVNAFIHGPSFLRKGFKLIDSIMQCLKVLMWIH